MSGLPSVPRGVGSGSGRTPTASVTNSVSLCEDKLLGMLSHNLVMICRDVDVDCVDVETLCAVSRL